MGLNGALVDVAITLEMKFGNLAAGATATKVFYTSLNGKQNGNDMTLGGNCADILNAGWATASLSSAREGGWTSSPVSRLARQRMTLLTKHYWNVARFLELIQSYKLIDGPRNDTLLDDNKMGRQKLNS